MPNIHFEPAKKAEFDRLWAEWISQLPKEQGVIVRARGIVRKMIPAAYVDLNNPQKEAVAVESDLVDFLIKQGFSFAIV
jgi:hypothetical protein